MKMQALVTIQEMEGYKATVLQSVKYRSWALTELCLIVFNDSDVLQCDEANIFKFRKSVQEIIRYINQNGDRSNCICIFY